MPTERKFIGPGLAMRIDRPEPEVETDRTDSPPVLYLHGLGSDQEGEKADFFREQFTTAGRVFVSIDFRGHGRSEGSNLDLSLSRNIEDAKIAREHLRDLGFDRVDVVGSSLGGLTALWFARQEPTAVRRVAVIAPAIGIRAKIGSLLGDTLLKRWRSDGNLPYVHELGTTVVGYGFWQDLERYPESRLIDTYTTPTLVLQGDLDETVDPSSVRSFAAALPCVTLKSWADGDHRLTDQLDELWFSMSHFLSS